LSRRVCIVTANHVACCPRMVKAADALTGAGHRVRVVSWEHVEWAAAAGLGLARARGWEWCPVDTNRRTGWPLYVRSSLRDRLARACARTVGVRRAPLAALRRLACRVAPELYAAAVARPADLVYGGTPGALAVVAAAAGALGAPYGLDLEDFHTAEQVDSPQARLAHAAVERIERAVLPGAAFLTAGSGPIADAYAEKYGLRPVPVNNVFPLPARPPEPPPPDGGPLRLYWFSQQIGPGRGLEDVIRAAGLLGRPASMSLLGTRDEAHLAVLKGLAAEVAPALRIDVLPPRPPDEMIDACRGFDVGLATETGRPLNRELCLTNKVFTYALAGLAVAVTDTRGQRPVAEDMGEGVTLYRPGDVPTLAAGLRRWAECPQALLRAKRASWEAARRRWHWEHPLERGALLAAVGRAWRDAPSPARLEGLYT
jgi:glycosyltransferase involved in cell wall biosynthesis